MSAAAKFIKVDGQKAVLTLFDADVERTVTVPCKFVICSHCSGSGQSSAYLGAYTADEMGQQDDEWQADYFAGRFDRPCDECREHPGRQVVPVLSALSRVDRKLWNDQVRDEIADRRLEAMERRMGA